MPHSLKDERARKALTRKLVDALQLSQVSGTALFAWDDAFNALKAEALKAVGTWMGEDDLTWSLMQLYRQAVAWDPNRDEAIMLLKDVMEPDEIESLAVTAVSLLASIPIEYDISYPLPLFPKIDDEIAVTEHVRLVPNDAGTRGGFFETEGAFVVIRAAGFASNSLQHSAVREAAATLKVTLRLGGIRKVFSEGQRRRRPISITFPPTLESEVSHFASVRQVSSGETSRIKLGSGLSRYLDGIRWNDRRGTELAEDMQHLSDPLKMMYSTDAENNVRSIRRALEWQFDAICDEDATTRFIKHCIGLEALLAEQSEEMGITEQLADRCAFLLGDTADERAKRRTMMREVYRLRSKIVHGSVSGLSHKDTLISSRAENLLSSLLAVELDSVEKWWARRLKRLTKP